MLYYHCQVNKVYTLALKHWGMEQARKILEMQFFFEISLPAVICTVSCLLLLAVNSKYTSLRWPFCLLQKYDSSSLCCLQHLKFSYSYSSVLTFGGCRDDFMIVVSQIKERSSGKNSTEKLLFTMAIPKVITK